MNSESNVAPLDTPLTVLEAANSISNNILPDKTRQKYEFVYKRSWIEELIKIRQTHSRKSVLLIYIEKIFKSVKLSTI